MEGIVNRKTHRGGFYNKISPEINTKLIKLLDNMIKLFGIQILNRTFMEINIVQNFKTYFLLNAQIKQELTSSLRDVYSNNPLYSEINIRVYAILNMPEMMQEHVNEFKKKSKNINTYEENVKKGIIDLNLIYTDIENIFQNKRAIERSGMLTRIVNGKLKHKFASDYNNGIQLISTVLNTFISKPLGSIKSWTQAYKTIEQVYENILNNIVEIAKNENLSDENKNKSIKSNLVNQLLKERNLDKNKLTSDPLDESVQKESDEPKAPDPLDESVQKESDEPEELDDNKKSLQLSKYILSSLYLLNADYRKLENENKPEQDNKKDIIQKKVDMSKIGKPNSANSANSTNSANSANYTNSANSTNYTKSANYTNSTNYTNLESEQNNNTNVSSTKAMSRLFLVSSMKSSQEYRSIQKKDPTLDAVVVEDTVFKDNNELECNVQNVIQNKTNTKQSCVSENIMEFFIQLKDKIQNKIEDTGSDTLIIDILDKLSGNWTGIYNNFSETKTLKNIQLFKRFIDILINNNYDFILKNKQIDSYIGLFLEEELKLEKMNTIEEPKSELKGGERLMQPSGGKIGDKIRNMKKKTDSSDDLKTKIEREIEQVLNGSLKTKLEREIQRVLNLNGSEEQDQEVEEGKEGKEKEKEGKMKNRKEEKSIVNTNNSLNRDKNVKDIHNIENRNDINNSSRIDSGSEYIIVNNSKRVIKIIKEADKVNPDHDLNDLSIFMDVYKEKDGDPKLMDDEDIANVEKLIKFILCNIELEVQINAVQTLNDTIPLETQYKYNKGQSQNAESNMENKKVNLNNIEQYGEDETKQEEDETKQEEDIEKIYDRKTPVRKSIQKEIQRDLYNKNKPLYILIQDEIQRVLAKQ